MKLRSARRPAIVATATVAVFAVAFGGQAAADAFITGDDVKNNSLSGADIRNNSISWADIANGAVRGTEIRNGSVELKDMSDDAMVELFTYIGEFLEYLEIFTDLQSLKDDASALQTRVATAEGTIGDLVDDLAAVITRVDALETASGVTNENVNALRLRIKAVEESLETLAPDVAALKSDVAALKASAMVDSNWGVQLRNTIGSASANLRQGPASSAFGPLIAPPAGTGSLQIDTANGASKVAFGNEVDWSGVSVDEIGSPSYSVFTTKENVTAGGGAANINVPTLNFELNPDVAGSNGYTSLVFTPTVAPTQGIWTTYAATDGYWWFTNGPTATATGCGQANSCTLVQALAGLGDNATVRTVAINKGRDYEFHGAVDRLVVGDTTYDFEARGVIATVAE